jgi:catechol 2,3-dioxygenase-like lactoylglutathione lyase family enzyme
MEIKRIAIFSIPVSNQQAAKTFYREKLGFEVRRDNPMGPDQQWIEVAPPYGQTSLTLVTWFENMPPGSVQGVVLDVDNVEVARTELVTKGVEVSPIEIAPWGAFATFRDPDGNGYVLQQAAPVELGG